MLTTLTPDTATVYDAEGRPHSFPKALLALRRVKPGDTISDDCLELLIRGLRRLENLEQEI